MNPADDDLALITIAALASLLGRNKQTVTRLVESGAIPVAYVDPDTGERYFTRAVLLAQQRRLGELHAEAAAAERMAAAALAAEAVADAEAEPESEAESEPEAAAPPAEEVAAEQPGAAAEPEPTRKEIPPVGERTGWSLDRTLSAAIARRNAEQLRSGTSATRTEGDEPVGIEAASERRGPAGRVTP